MVEVKLEDVRAGQMGQSQVVILKDMNRQRFLSIWIGTAEAESIRIQMKGLQVPRPLTHDLIVSVIHALGTRLIYVVVSDLRDDTFYARMVLRTHDNRELSVDSRPSDAIAVAIRAGCPIFVDEDIMDQHARVIRDEEEEHTSGKSASSGGDDEDLGAFKDFLSSLDI